MNRFNSQFSSSTGGATIICSTHKSHAVDRVPKIDNKATQDAVEDAKAKLEVSTHPDANPNHNPNPHLHLNLETC